MDKIMNSNIRNCHRKFLAWRSPITYQVTYQVRPHLIQGELGADEAKGPCGPASP